LIIQITYLYNILYLAVFVKNYKDLLMKYYYEINRNSKYINLNLALCNPY